MGLCDSQPRIEVYAQLNGTIQAAHIATFYGPLPATLIAARVGGEYISMINDCKPIQGAVTLPCSVVRRPKADRTKANLGMCRWCLGQFSTEDDIVKHYISVCLRSREYPLDAILTREDCAAAEAPKGRSYGSRL